MNTQCTITGAIDNEILTPSRFKVAGHKAAMLSPLHRHCQAAETDSQVTFKMKRRLMCRSIRGLLRPFAMILSVATLQMRVRLCAETSGRERKGLGGMGGLRRGVRSPGTEPTPADFKGVGRDGGNTLHNQSETIRREREWLRLP